MNEEQIRSACMEMTGTSQEPEDAFEQWKLERESMIAFFQQIEAQEKLLHRLKRCVAEIRLQIYGKEDITGDEPAHISKTNWQKMAELIIALQRWNQEEYESEITSLLLRTSVKEKQMSFLEKIDEAKV